MFGVRGELFDVGAHALPARRREVHEVGDELFGHVAERHADPSHREVLEGAAQRGLIAGAHLHHPVVEPVLEVRPAEDGDGPVPRPHAQLRIRRAVRVQELQQARLPDVEHDDGPGLAVAVHAEPSVVPGLPVTQLAAVVVDEAGRGQEPPGLGDEVAVQELQPLEDPLHDRRQRLAAQTAIVAVVGLGVVAERGELPRAQPVHRPREAAGVSRAAGVVGVLVALLPDGHDLAEVGDQLLRLLLTDESGEVGEPRSLDRSPSILGDAHAPVPRVVSMRNSTLAVAASLRWPAAVCPERSRGVSRWFPSSSQCTRTQSGRAP